MPADRKTAPESPRKTPESAEKAGSGQAESRQDRLARTLRDNLRKRKAQQRQRQGGGV